ncbi:MAG TPA: hypothetical protein VFN03_06555, partial [Trueperaceae bacterium]|nr:hypothetical protein [Trueperaceae bacterium]
MSRRTRTTAIFLVLLLALVVVAPALPIVREAIVTRVLGSLSGSGISIAYRATSGNAWRSITLHDVEARGLGADVRLETLTIGYFLPSLLGGELPIDVLVAGATGDVDVKRLLDESMGDTSGGAAGPISLRLRKIDLQDIGVSLAQVPFTLPDANIGSLSVTQDGTVLDLGAVVSTSDGEATIAGRYDALTSVFTGRVTQADATIARHWWDGVTAGNVTGTVTIRGSTIDGDFVLEGGAVDDLGLNATDVSGDVTMRYPVITAELDGNVFGGRAAATGVVNVTAERWEASGGGTADLGQAADWLARSLLPDGVPLPMTGSVDVDLTVVGWEEIDLHGTATGNGTLADMPIEGLRATFAVAEDGDLTVEANAFVGGGPIALTIGPDARGERIIATATDVLLAIDGNDLGTLNATLDMAADGPQDGSLLASWQADLAGRAVDARLDGRLDPDGWQAFITGRDDLGTSLEGAVVLDDGLIQGAVTVVDIAGLPLSPGARVVVAASGPVSEPTLTVALAGDQPVTLAVGPPELLLFEDLRGSLTGTVLGTSVPDLVGAFGPVRVSGTLGLSPIAADLALTLDERTFAYGDTATALVAITESVLRIDPDGATWNGAISTSGVSVGPLMAATGALNASASFGGAAGQDAADGLGQPWTVTLAGDQPVTLAVGPPELLLFEDLRGSLTGTVSGTSVPDLVGTFGPVRVSGTLGLSPIAADLALTLDERT